MLQTQFASVTQKVDVIHNSVSIGSGTAEMEGERLAITGSYEWPPDAPAEVAFSFHLELRQDRTCSIEVDWPGLLPNRIADDQASYFILLILARPQINVFNQDQTFHATVFFQGPPNQPPVVNAISIGVQESSPPASPSLLFRYVE